jgi:hypothetical protein
MYVLVLHGQSLQYSPLTTGLQGMPLVATNVGATYAWGRGLPHGGRPPLTGTKDSRTAFSLSLSFLISL